MRTPTYPNNTHMIWLLLALRQFFILSRSKTYSTLLNETTFTHSMLSSPMQIPQTLAIVISVLCKNENFRSNGDFLFNQQLLQNVDICSIMTMLLNIYNCTKYLLHNIKFDISKRKL